MNRSVSVYAFTFTLAGILAIVTIFAICLAAGRAFGYLSVGLFLVAPWPVIGYMRFVRRVVSRVDFDSRSRFANLVFAVGLLLAGGTTLLLLGAGIVNLKH